MTKADAVCTEDLDIMKTVLEKYKNQNQIDRPYPSGADKITNKKLRKWFGDNVDTWIIYDTEECREKLTPTLLEVLRKLGPIDFSASPLFPDSS